VTLYAKLVEFYDKKGDVIKDYFMEKIQIIATTSKRKNRTNKRPANQNPYKGQGRPNGEYNMNTGGSDKNVSFGSGSGSGRMVDMSME